MQNCHIISTSLPPILYAELSHYLQFTATYLIRRILALSPVQIHVSCMQKFRIISGSPYRLIMWSMSSILCCQSCGFWCDSNKYLDSNWSRACHEALWGLGGLTMLIFNLGQVSGQLESIAAVVLVGGHPVPVELEAGWEPRCSWLRRQKVIAPAGNRTPIPWTSYYGDWATADFDEIGNWKFSLWNSDAEMGEETRKKNVRSCSWLIVVTNGKWSWFIVEYGGKCNWLMWYPVGTLCIKRSCNRELPSEGVTAVYTWQASADT